MAPAGWLGEVMAPKVQASRKKLRKAKPVGAAKPSRKAKPANKPKLAKKAKKAKPIAEPTPVMVAKPIAAARLRRAHNRRRRWQLRQQRWRYLLWRVRSRLYVASHWIVAQLTSGAFSLLRRLSPEQASDIGGWATRTFGPLLPVHRVGLENLRHAFPEKSERERRAILREVWDNLGRTGAEFIHLEDLWDYDPDNPEASRIEGIGVEQFVRLRDDGKPAIIFSAHLGNWELPAVCAARHGLPVAVVFRAPNNPHLARRVEETRARNMGELLQAGSGQAVVFLMAGVLERGGHLGILVDQYLRRGLALPFFGRIAHTNPTLGRLARQFDCPVHGARVIRLPGNRFRLELTDAIDLPRDGDGRVDVEETMKVVNGIIEGWVREHPGQWLWLHRRWR